MIRIYTARAMSFREKAEVYAEAEKDRDFLTKAGFEVLCPVHREKIKNEKGIIRATAHELKKNFWPLDKAMIQDSHILFHMSPHLNSAGAWQEVGYKRYHLQGPVVHVFPSGQLPPAAYVPRLENDYVCDSLEEAIEYTLRVHGTFWKRTKWRLNKLNRCFVKSFVLQLKEWIK